LPNKGAVEVYTGVGKFGNFRLRLPSVWLLWNVNRKSGGDDLE